MFGGAGGQHACSIAKTLGIRRIIVPRYSSLLSAHGMALADVVREVQEPAAYTISGGQSNSEISSRLKGLVKRAVADLQSQGFSEDRIGVETYLNCRYHGTSTKLMIETPEDGDYEKRFFDDHKREFGFNLEKRDILVDDLRVRATGRSVSAETRSPYADFEEMKKAQVDRARFSSKEVFFDGPHDGWQTSALIPLKDLEAGSQVAGPAIIFDETQTLLVEPGHIVGHVPSQSQTKLTPGNGFARACHH
jgi:5-oxoprolinase (ATP-hydrolysing)